MGEDAVLDLSVIIVNYNARDRLKDCLVALSSVLKSVRFEVIVVDNASQDGSDLLKQDFPYLLWIQNDVNRGFSAANNQGARSARGQNLLILNNDTLILNDRMAEVITFSQQHHVGIVGLGLVNPDGTVQRQGSLLSAYLWRKTQPIGVDFVIGAAFLIPRDLYTTLGGFDEQFNFYNEDLDLCRRVRQAGYSIYYYPMQKICHFGGHQKRIVSDFAIREGYRGSLYFVLKHYGNPWLSCYKILVLFDIIYCVILTRLFALYRQEKQDYNRMRSAYQNMLRWVIAYK